jgi:hypothetical protein
MANFFEKHSLKKHFGDQFGSMVEQWLCLNSMIVGAVNGH